MKKYKFKTPDGIELKLEIRKTGFTLWTKRNWLIDASCIQKDGLIRLCKPVKWPWGEQRYDYELQERRVPKGYTNQFHEHKIVSRLAKSPKNKGCLKS